MESTSTRPRPLLRILATALLVSAASAVAPTTTPAAPTYRNQSATACKAQCVVNYPSAVEYSWVQTGGEVETVTSEITVATLIVFIDDTTNKTSTSTEYAHSTVTANITSGTTQTSVVTFERAPGDVVTATVAYPTPYLDYSALYTVETGSLPTGTGCKTFSDAATYNLGGSHPPLPTPSQDFANFGTNNSNPLGLGYELQSIDLFGNAAEFTSFYKASFTDQAAVESCAVIPNPPTFVTSSPAPFSSGFAPPETTKVTDTFTNAPSSAVLTHTTVSLLTATSTSHVNHAPWATSTPPGGHGDSPPYTGAQPDQSPSSHPNQPGDQPHDQPGHPHDQPGQPHEQPGQPHDQPGQPHNQPGNQPTKPPVVDVSHHTYPATPTFIGTTPAVVVDGHTVHLGGSSTDVDGTPIRLTVATSDGKTVTGVVVGHGGGAFGGSAQSTVPLDFVAPLPTLAACGSNIDVTPTAVISDAKTIPAIVANGQTVMLEGDGVNLCGTPIHLTAVTSGSSTVTQAIVGGASGGAAESSIPITFPDTLSVEGATGSPSIGGYIVSGLGGGSQPTDSSSPGGSGSGPPTSTRFPGAAAHVADRASRVGVLGLIFTGILGLLVW